MDVFIRIVTTGKTFPLNQEKWSNIMIDYLDAVGSQTAKKRVKYDREIEYLTNEIYIIKLLVERGFVSPCDGIFERLRSKGYRLQFTEETRLKDLDSVLLMLKSKELRVKQLKDELAESDELNKPPTESDYYKQLDMLAEQAHVAVIDPSQLTVAQYCAKIVRFTERQEALLKKENGRR